MMGWIKIILIIILVFLVCLNTVFAVWPRPKGTYLPNHKGSDVDHLALGYNKMWEGNYSGALNEFSYILSHIEPKTYYFNMGVNGICELSSKIQKDFYCPSWYPKAMKYSVDTIKYQTARWFFENSDYRNSFHVLNEMIKDGSKDPSTHYATGLCLMNLNKRLEANRYFSNAIALGMSQSRINEGVRLNMFKIQ